MIDLEKQREVVHNAINTLFDIAKVQKAEIDLLNVDIANKQAEINELKKSNSDVILQFLNQAIHDSACAEERQMLQRFIEDVELNALCDKRKDQKRVSVDLEGL